MFRFSYLPLAIIALALPWPAAAQSAENVAVIINTASPDSQRVAEHYFAARQIPEANVFRIETTTDESIERDAYVRSIETPIGAAIREAGLQDRVLYLVLTKGILGEPHFRQLEPAGPVVAAG